ncbi:hypothetical protein [Homoserinimonas aerilata]|uniref:hypothetical protein n=1 Tax=Homoserinimonas aerilata TaxID=1162970 RepID=UPI00114F1D5B|nr:hypothetical protein [Homoserinimonas aerilata]
MNEANLIVNFALMAATVASAIVAWWQAFGAVKAKRLAEDARDAAVGALERSARALEDSNDLVKRFAPAEEASWEIESLQNRPHEYFVRNVGIRMARNVVLSAHPPLQESSGASPGEGETGIINSSAKAPRDVEPNNVIQFNASVYLTGPRLRLRVDWEDEDGSARHAFRDMP